MARPLGSGARGLPRCPDPAHAGGRVTLNGRYGAHHPRQRYRCYPPQGDAHTFTGTLVHQVVGPGEACEHCERLLASHEGLTVARKFEVPVQEVARALVLVGRGVSYTEAGRRCRVRVGRAVTEHGLAQMVAGWVEVFTPVVTARWDEPSWPDTVVLDSTWFTGNLPGGGRGRIFYVLVAYGYDAGRRNGRVLSLSPVTRGNGAAWQSLMASKSGQPHLLVSDKDTGLQAAVPQAWPTTVWRLCRWHLRKNLGEELRAAGIDLSPGHPVTSRAAHAFDDLANWRDFRRAVSRRGTSDLRAWVADQDPYLVAEFAAGPLTPLLTAGAADVVLRQVRATIARRAFCYRNQPRTALMLDLMRLRLNHVDDETTYAHDIRAYLDAGGQLGRVLALRDPAGRPSLR